MKLNYIKTAAVKLLARSNGRRCSKAYLIQLDALVGRKVEAACRVHNGGKITLDATIAAHTL